MNDAQNMLADLVVILINGSVGKDTIVERAVIEEKARTLAPSCGITEEQQIVEVIHDLEGRYQISMGDGSLFTSSETEFEPWLEDFQSESDNVIWYYWKRYKLHLGKQGFPPMVITKIDDQTDKILGLLEYPEKNGGWKRRGLVVGYVQSGKTANYTGVICKAADAGYKVIVVLAGMLNSLRDQTQARIDEGFVGQDITRITKKQGDSLVGVGKLNGERLAVTFTNRKSDFRKSIAESLAVNAGHFTEPVILVVKKNTSTLKNLVSWLDTSNIGKPLNDAPMLLIDDEADQASINTNTADKDPTRINEMIRKLLATFSRASFIGYTATPFANVFIDPLTDDDMLGDDLFPRDFIFSLDAPSNYVSAERIFGDNDHPDGHLDILRDIDDNEPQIPLKHKKDLRPEMPESLKEAIRAYVLILAIRSIRGQSDKHNSMMVNVSRFTNTQTHLKNEIMHYIAILKENVGNHYRLGEHEALTNTVMRELNETWMREFSRFNEPRWKVVQNNLNRGLSKVKVIEVNSSKTSEPLVYEGYEGGRNIIAVGGLSLSRGLTLEGLVVSYFLRNSVMYDTLMQMGRWFGYRDGYDDLCRIYMLPEAQSWYSHVSSATEELRAEFTRMEMARMTPAEFGLQVRSHPESLIVTARNKMRNGESITKQVSLFGRLVESATLSRDINAINQNRELLKRTIKQLDVGNAERKNGSSYLWREVDLEIVTDFINGFNNHPYSQLTQSQPILDYMKKLRDEDGVASWDVALYGVGSGKGLPYEFDGITLNTQTRTLDSKRTDKGKLLFNKLRVGSRGSQEGIVLSDDERQKIKESSKKKAVSDAKFRQFRSRPLLMIHPVTLFVSGDESPLFDEPVIAFGVSFHGDSAVTRGHLVDYVVNTVYWNNEYGDLLEDEEEEGN